MITMPASVTGAAQTGFTTPTYTLTVDTPPDVNSKQSVVTALGGTQAGVDTHMSSKPFTLTFSRPKSFNQVSVVNPQTGLLKSSQNNTYKCLVRKGVIPLAGQPAKLATVRISVEVPAGADVADAANVKAALSLAIGALNQLSASIGDTALNGVL